jgi:hypothetical protein
MPTESSRRTFRAKIGRKQLEGFSKTLILGWPMQQPKSGFVYLEPARGQIIDLSREPFAKKRDIVVEGDGNVVIAEGHSHGNYGYRWSTKRSTVDVLPTDGGLYLFGGTTVIQDKLCIFELVLIREGVDNLNPFGVTASD